MRRRIPPARALKGEMDLKTRRDKRSWNVESTLHLTHIAWERADPKADYK
jgi:hypothetical protein